MILKVADLLVDVPALGDLPRRCEPYRADGLPDLVLEPDALRPDRHPQLSPADNYYLDSGALFYRKLPAFGGLMLHASAVRYHGRAYLFSAPCGVGKSTHARLWLSAFGSGAAILNDDKPALRRRDGVWYAFGTPWCGKDGINTNDAAPIAGICFLFRGDTKIEPLAPLEALPLLLRQTVGLGNAQNAARLMPLVNDLVCRVPFFRFYNHADPSDPLATCGAMSGPAPEVPHETK